MLKQAKELSDYLENNYGIKPAAGGAVVMAGPRPTPAARAAPAAEQTEFDLVLEAPASRRSVSSRSCVRSPAWA